uniref:Uncharacterized protein n=1 Tax=Romanomermis culicivorax TaxID=13658 RepID=A0A915K8E6_ROMCU
MTSRDDRCLIRLLEENHQKSLPTLQDRNVVVCFRRFYCTFIVFVVPRMRPASTKWSEQCGPWTAILL